MLEQLETIESAEQAVKEKEAQLEGFIQSCREKKDALVAREKGERQAVDTLNEKKMQISAKADPKMISILDEVKKKGSGDGGGACSGGHLHGVPLEHSGAVVQ
jgi:predicted  nucleic acid-binding Zn-ribbon protein